MSRLTKASESPAPFADDIYEASPEPSRPRGSNVAPASMSPSPVASVSSDKENRASRAPLDKGKGRMPMGPPSGPSPASERVKRKRTADRDTPVGRTRRRRTVEADENIIDGDYDPDQDIEVRRQVRGGLRDLTKSLNEQRSEFLAPGNTGLRDTLLNADQWTTQVKQTSDATIDARLLVQTADLSYKKTIALTTGDTSQGVDLEDFLSKCRAYMRAAPAGEVEGGGQRAPSSTQRRRGRHDDEEDEDGDMFNWAYFGRVACLPHISRPAVPGFLLGPLSVEKRAKRVVVRKAALRINAIQETRPEVLQKNDIEKSENANLTTLCTQILSRAMKVQADAMAKAELEHDENMSQKEIDAVLDKHGISAEGELAFLKFIINPNSFGQTIENLFYVSFLVRDGKAAITVGDDGMPYLSLPAARPANAPRDEGQSKHQAVLALDMAQWKEAIELFDIKEPIIRHREEESYSSVGKKGWYA
ncbi:Non-structural maintenance of chromosome element [Lachnellula occidentalis]|uniref:Non-structural maintenance of chromosomes element 4 n=1 Tax=Lachnellula occidentalis TaxID=215460 RepID=A0A8H8UJB7_9HELO|nr:Non-structural maintenance of chromosome element [Lachnellula occidentalis]